MALGDGITWDEDNPVDGTTAILIDDHMRDLRKGFRGRFALEHEMPASQSATSEGGKHKYITLQEQGTKPTLSGTQKGALYSKTDHKLYFENSAGTEIVIVAGTAVGDGKVLVNATDAAANFMVNKIGSGLINSGTNIDVATTVVRNLGDGLDIIQRGSGQCGNNANATVSFGTNFADTKYSIGITLVDAADTSGAIVQQALLAGTLAAGSMVVINNNAQVRNFTYICVGSQG